MLQNYKRKFVIYDVSFYNIFFSLTFAVLFLILKEHTKYWKENGKYIQDIVMRPWYK